MYNIHAYFVVVMYICIIQMTCLPTTLGLLTFIVCPYTEDFKNLITIT